MTLAICIRCGAAKRKPEAACKDCGFKPRSDEDKAKSLILSLFYEIDGEYRGTTKAELLIVAEAIRRGDFEFDPQEVAAVIAYAHEVTRIPAREFLVGLVRWLGPPLLILAVVFWLLWSTK